MCLFFYKSNHYDENKPNLTRGAVNKVINTLLFQNIP